MLTCSKTNSQDITTRIDLVTCETPWALVRTKTSCQWHLFDVSWCDLSTSQNSRIPQHKLKWQHMQWMWDCHSYLSTPVSKGLLVPVWVWFDMPTRKLKEWSAFTLRSGLIIEQLKTSWKLHVDMFKNKLTRHHNTNWPSHLWNTVSTRTDENFLPVTPVRCFLMRPFHISKHWPLQSGKPGMGKHLSRIATWKKENRQKYTGPFCRGMMWKNLGLPVSPENPEMYKNPFCRGNSCSTFQIL